MQRLILVIIIILQHVFLSCLSAAQEQIIVRLTTDNPLLPLYVLPINGSSGFDSSYHTQLEAVLHFDLDHNGMTRLVAPSAERAAFAKKSLNSPEAISFWKNSSVYYVVKPQITGQRLSIQILSVNSGVLQTMEAVTLTGRLGEDRRTIHQLVDAMHQELFGSRGIASTRFLYAVRTRPEKGSIGGDDSTKWISEIWEADYDGANARQITHDHSYNISPVYIPPKTGFSSGSFLYVSYQTSQPKIFAATLSEGVGQRVSTLKGNQLMPMPARQRDKIAFISDVTGNPDLFLQTFDAETVTMGKPYQIFASPHATQGSPTFSPDGKRVAFVSDKDGSAKIYIIDVPAAGAQIKDLKTTLLTKHGRENTAPAWSPDGSKMAYTAKTDGVRQIWIYDLITGEERQLTQGPGHKENPTWAPNSLHIIFNSSLPDSSELYLVNLNQQEACKISSGAGEKRFPSWEMR